MWSPKWAERPAAITEGLLVAEERFRAAASPLPVFGHLFIPAPPPEAGNRVFSIHQSGTILFGNDLADSFANEFGAPRPTWSRTAPRSIPVWSRLAADPL